MDLFLPRLSFLRPEPEYRSLDGVDRAVLYHTFSAAFSDYSIRIRLSYGRFSEMLDTNCFVPELSAGAFCGRRMVGVVLNGLRPYEGELTAYDCGTGVIPRLRNQGIARQMLDSLFGRLRQVGATRYLLEVLCRNEPAVHLYRQMGFCPTREFACFRAPRSHPVFHTPAAVTRLPVRELLADSRCRRFYDFAPAWQNSAEQIASLPGCLAWASTAQGALRGFGILNPRNGVVHVLAVAPDARRQGVGSSLMAAMCSAAEGGMLSVLNVDTRCVDMLCFLESYGFSRTAGQYEMIRKL